MVARVAPAEATARAFPHLMWRCSQGLPSAAARLWGLAAILKSPTGRGSCPRTPPARVPRPGRAAQMRPETEPGTGHASSDASRSAGCTARDQLRGLAETAQFEPSSSGSMAAMPARDAVDVVARAAARGSRGKLGENCDGQRRCAGSPITRPMEPNKSSTRPRRRPLDASTRCHGELPGFAPNSRKTRNADARRLVVRRLVEGISVTMAAPTSRSRTTRPTRSNACTWLAAPAGARRQTLPNVYAGSQNVPERCWCSAPRLRLLQDRRGGLRPSRRCRTRTRPSTPWGRSGRQSLLRPTRDVAFRRLAAGARHRCRRRRLRCARSCWPRTSRSALRDVDVFGLPGPQRRRREFQQWHRRRRRRRRAGGAGLEMLRRRRSCRTFPFDVQVAAAALLRRGGEGGSRDASVSRRAALPDARALIEARLNAAATSSICARSRCPTDGRRRSTRAPDAWPSPNKAPSTRVTARAWISEAAARNAGARRFRSKS